MSSKTNQQQGRRTPLSLTGSGGVGTTALSGTAGTQRNVKPSPTSNGNSKQDIKGATNKIDNKLSANIQNELKKAGNNDNNKVEKLENDKKDQQNGINSNKSNGNESNGHSVKAKKTDKTEKVENNEKDNKKQENDETKNVEKKSEKEQKSNKVEITKEKLTEKGTAKEQKANKTDSPKGAAQQEATKNTEKINAEKQTKNKSPTTKQNKSEQIVEEAAESEEVASKKVTASAEKISTNKPSTRTDTPKKKNNDLVDDFEMETLVMDSSPIKPQNVAILQLSSDPTATSTPGKIKPTTAKHLNLSKTEVEHTIQTGDITPARTYTQISGRRSIRPLSEITPSKYSSSLPYRESYRRINTELDTTTNSNTSMNVTVGSEVPNNSSFSFFGRRKRERTSPNSTATQELALDVEMNSPPKRARIEGVLSALATPITLIRSRFAKASLKNESMNLEAKLNEVEIEKEEEQQVQNVSGVSIEQEKEQTNVEEATVEEAKEQQLLEKNKISAEEGNVDAESQVVETDLDKEQATSVSKRCLLM